MTANNIDEVIDILNDIIKRSKQEQSPLGYFAALYKKVTIEVKSKLGTGYFDNDERIELLDVVFANRYLEAYTNYKANLNTTLSWRTVFEETKNNDLIVLQHLLLGMNAHINLDLGIAAAEIAPEEAIHSLEKDFNRINEILASLVNEVQEDLSNIWPILKWILKKLHGSENLIVDFSMKLARNGAWKFAKEIAFVSAEQKKIRIKIRDAQINDLAAKITQHGFFIRFIFWIIRATEVGSVEKKIELLET